MGPRRALGPTVPSLEGGNVLGAIAWVRSGHAVHRVGVAGAGQRLPDDPRHPAPSAPTSPWTAAGWSSATIQVFLGKARSTSGCAARRRPAGSRRRPGRTDAASAWCPARRPMASVETTPYQIPPWSRASARDGLDASLRRQLCGSARVQLDSRLLHTSGLSSADQPEVWNPSAGINRSSINWASMAPCLNALAAPVGGRPAARFG